MTLTGKDRKGIEITMLFPVTGKVTDCPVFDAARMHESWPNTHGHWDGEVWGRSEWDDEQGVLVVDWSDGDTTLVDLRPNLELYAGRILTFTSVQNRTSDVLVVQRVEEA